MLKILTTLYLINQLLTVISHLNQGTSKLSLKSPAPSTQF